MKFGNKIGWPTTKQITNVKQNIAKKKKSIKKSYITNYLRLVTGAGFYKQYHPQGQNLLTIGKNVGYVGLAPITRERSRQLL